jgi:hypothetical protein
VVYRIRLIEPISADFPVLVGDAIRNLRSSLDQVASLGTAVHRAAEAISKRSREDDVARSPEAERDKDLGFVLNRLRNVYKRRRLPLLAAMLAHEGGR